MTLNEYQEQAKTTAQFEKDWAGLMYCLLGLSGEVGEVNENFKKLYRNAGFKPLSIGYEVKLMTVKELGDILWYLTMIADLMGYSLEEVGEINLKKLKERYPHV